MKKLLSLCLIVTVLGTILMGCVSKEINPNKSEEEKEIEIRIATMFGGTDPAAPVLKQQLESFHAANPHITIVNESMTSVGDEYRTVIKTDFSTGNEADVVFFYNGVDVQGIIDVGGVVPYEEIWKTYPEVGENITDAVKEFMREKDGNLYCLPLTGFYEGLFVNKEIFDKYDLELPTTWENFTKAVEVLHDNGEVPIAGPLSQSLYMIEHLIYAEAGVIEYQSTLDEGIPQSWIEGLDHFRSLYILGAFSEDALSMDVEAAQNLFIDGGAAMIFEGSWFIGRCDEELRNKMTVVPMPTAPGGDKDPTDVVAGYSSGYYVSRIAYDDEEKQEAVIELVTYLTSLDAISAIASANGGTPSAVIESTDLEQIVLDGQTMVNNANAIALPIDSRLRPEAFNYIVKDGVPFIAYGEKTAEEVLVEVKKINDK